MKKNKDWAGQKHHMLTFIKPCYKDKASHVLWEVLCDCGNTSKVIPWNVTHGTVRSCGCYSKSIRSLNGEKRRKQDPIISSAKVVWRTYKDRTIDFETFYKVSQQPCYYCGRLPHRNFNLADYPRKKGGQSSNYQREHGNFIYNGLDRIDSSKDHSPDNVVPCCWDCNRMKGTLSKVEFINHIKLILSNQLRCGHIILP